MKTIPLNLDLQTASALYILLDTSIASLSAEKIAVEELKTKQQEKPSKEDLEELSNHLDAIIESGKELASDVAEIIEMFGDEKPEFKPFA